MKKGKGNVSSVLGALGTRKMVRPLSGTETLVVGFQVDGMGTPVAFRSLQMTSREHFFSEALGIAPMLSTPSSPELGPSTQSSLHSDHAPQVHVTPCGFTNNHKGSETLTQNQQTAFFTRPRPRRETSEGWVHTSPKSELASAFARVLKSQAAACSVETDPS